jgi:hypothetical protein
MVFVYGIIIKSMRTTLYIPDEFYQRIKESYKAKGYNTINDLLLALIRHYFNAKDDNSHQFNAGKVDTSSGAVTVKMPKVELAHPPEKEKPVKKPKVDHSGYMCKHGRPRHLCEFKGSKTKCEA